MDANVRKYLAEIGRRGGRTSRRTLTAEQARNMVRIREAQRLYRNLHARCFWSSDPDLKITLELVPWVADKVRRYGGRDEWYAAQRLCL